MRNILITILLGIGLSACITPKTWVATGGSRSDATVELSYQYGGFEKPKVNQAQGAKTAHARCKAWGYSESEAFGGALKTCNSYGQYGCMGWLVTMKYQCTNKK